MKYELKLANRYLFSKKTTNAINIISMIAALGMLVGTAALLLVLSVFNGFEEVVASLYNTFNPDIKITAQNGKVFSPDSLQLHQIQQTTGVKALSLVLEENAFLKYNDNDLIGRLKGVDTNFTQVSALDTTIREGEFKLSDGQYNFAVLGAGVQQMLGVNIYNDFARLQVFMPRREGKVSTMQIENAFKQAIIYPAGVFLLQQDFDSKYLIVSLPFMRQLLDYRAGEVSALEIAVEKPTQVNVVCQLLRQQLGSEYKVQNRYEQDEFLYKVMRNEKWAVYLILTFILIVASFNIVGSLSMLVLEKKNDIAILKAMGASSSFIQRVFMLEGLLLALLGAGLGVALAAVICWLQMKFGWLKIAGNSFLIESYPVKMQISDFILVFFTAVAIALAAAYVPALRGAQQNTAIKNE